VGLLEYPTYSQVVGFVENFDGDGPYDGFYTPGMTPINLDYEFVDGALSFARNRGDDRVTLLTTPIVGSGSSKTTMEIRDLYLGDLMCPCGFDVGLILLWHGFGSPGTGFLISLKEVDSFPPFGPENWAFLIDPLPMRGEHVPIPESTGHTMRLELVFENISKQYTVSYDHNVDDNIAPLVFGPNTYTGEVKDTNHRLELGFDNGGQGGPVTGLLDYLAVQPFVPLRGDFNINDVLDVDDVNRLLNEIRNRRNTSYFDLNDDGRVNQLDTAVWVHDLKKTYFGDANLDGEFQSLDLVQLFQAGTYEDGIVENSLWQTGDWTGDKEFTSSDLVLAFEDGGYEQGPRPRGSSVPEPNAGVLFMVGISWAWHRRRWSIRVPDIL
jgi:hypothetical protein